MNERREIRLRLVELVAQAVNANLDRPAFFEIVLNMERFVLDADVAKSEPSADSAASETAGTSIA